MSSVAGQALGLWGMDGASRSLVAARENRVHRVAHGGREYALRLHRPGYRSDAELASELMWTGEAARCGLPVPHPVASMSGDLLRSVDGIQVSVLEWLPGDILGAAEKGLPPSGRAGLYSSLGRELARLHEVSDAWRPPEGFVRQAWDREGLLGERPVWNRFWENPALTSRQRETLEETREVAGRELARIGDSLDQGLIHADILVDNVLVEDGRVKLIDFDDGGPGYRLFELATPLFKLRGDPDCAALRVAMLEGYRSVRPLDDGPMDLFILLRALTYVGWIITRMEIEGAEERCRQSIEVATGMAEEYLGRSGGPPKSATA